MSERLKVYIGFIIVIPILVAFFINHFALVPEDLVGITYFLCLISTHLIVSKIQEMLY
ncbi:hypothetical protein GN156_14210 [bacterium LRH843]|nr:hypothetical protein [bacterium LRH843]